MALVRSRFAMGYGGVAICVVARRLGMMFVGGAMCMFGFVGAFSRYIAAEQAPVAKDTINYMADGTQEAVRTVARAAAQGVTEGVQRAQAITPDKQ